MLSISSITLNSNTGSISSSNGEVIIHPKMNISEFTRKFKLELPLPTISGAQNIPFEGKFYSETIRGEFRFFEGQIQSIGWNWPHDQYPTPEESESEVEVFKAIFINKIGINISNSIYDLPWGHVVAEVEQISMTPVIGIHYKTTGIFFRIRSLFYALLRDTR